MTVLKLELTQMLEVVDGAHRRSVVDCPAFREQHHVVKRPKNAETRLMNAEDDCPASTGQTRKKEIDSSQRSMTWDTFRTVVGDA